MYMSLNSLNYDAHALELYKHVLDFTLLAFHILLEGEG